MIAENLALLRKSIPMDKVTVIAVTKTQPPEVVREAYASGLTIVGENRVQEAVEKAASLSEWAKESVQITEYFVLFYFLLLNNLKAIKIETIFYFFFISISL